MLQLRGTFMRQNAQWLIAGKSRGVYGVPDGAPGQNSTRGPHFSPIDLTVDDVTSNQLHVLSSRSLEILEDRTRHEIRDLYALTGSGINLAYLQPRREVATMTGENRLCQTVLKTPPDGTIAGPLVEHNRDRPGVNPPHEIGHHPATQITVEPLLVLSQLHRRVGLHDASPCDPRIRLCNPSQEQLLCVVRTPVEFELDGLPVAVEVPPADPPRHSSEHIRVIGRDGDNH